MTVKEMKDHIDGMLAARPALEMSVVRVIRRRKFDEPKEWGVAGVRVASGWNSPAIVEIEVVK